MAAVKLSVARSSAENNKAEARDIVSSLLAAKPRISHNYLYDTKGSDLYEECVATPEYYLLAAEKRLMTEHLDKIAKPGDGGAYPAFCEDQLIVELGAGAGHRTHPLVKAMAANAKNTTYSPTDIR